MNKSQASFPSTPNWSDLVTAIKTGDSAAQATLYKELRSLLHYFCRNVGPDSGEDLFHQTIVELVEQIHRGVLRSPERLLGYVRTIARRKVAAQVDSNVSARKQYTVEDVEFRIRDHALDPESVSIRNEQRAIMGRILDSLRERDREVLVRFYLQEHSAEQIHQELGLTDTQFRLIKSRAKARFHDLCISRFARRQSKSISPVQGQRTSGNADWRKSPPLASASSTYSGTVFTGVA